MMRYLNFILTLIALLLLLHLFKPGRPAKAGDMTDVNIKGIGGYRVYDKILDVKIRK